MTILQMRFCEFLRHRRESLGLAQKVIAEAISVDVPMYSRYERGQRPLKEEYIPLIASKLKVSCSTLRQMWIADKIFNFVSGEENVKQILNIVADNIIDSINE
ncbi:MAG: helix-turn-helix transcriptional regulator [Muribaculaceae bacterium]|nr:helix-turn-helix transcriptional regulator [Muribaculaceae bacterium]